MGTEWRLERINQWRERVIRHIELIHLGWTYRGAHKRYGGPYFEGNACLLGFGVRLTRYGA